MSSWTFFSNHAHILFLIALSPTISVREISNKAGITERAVMKIISDLVKDDFISITKDGRRNIYKVNSDKHLRHEIEMNCHIGDIVKLVKKSQKTKK